MPLSSLKQHMERTFRQLASEKGLEFEANFSADLPESIRTDEKRLQQVVLNLLSNAFKFTAQGKVELDVQIAHSGWDPTHPVLRDVSDALQISVKDTGIGIPKAKQKLIFEAFQQADGTTSRKYGGTGLGLSISREIAGLLGGELQVRSTPGSGSTFTLYVPLRAADAPALLHPVAGDAAEGRQAAAVVEPTDDRGQIGKSPFVLIVEDDPAFAGILLDVAHDAGLKGIISPTGSGTAALAKKMQPMAITLDLGLSDIDGFVLLELLRTDPQTSNIPVHVISGGERAEDAIALGASGLIEKPADREALVDLFEGIAKSKTAGKRAPSAKRRQRRGEDSQSLAGNRILIIDDDIRNIYSLTSVLEAQGAEILHAERGADGIAILKANPDIDVALVDIMMPDMDGYETMRRIRQIEGVADMPLVAVTAKAMKGDRQKCLDAGASDYISKPVDIDLLLALVRVWIDRSRIDRQGSAASSESMAAA
jgi:CheY-like chemotaxis protein